MSRRGQFYTLRSVFIEAEAHARSKGNDRHALSPAQPFEEQPICALTRQIGLGFPLGQAVKKILESQQLSRYPARAKAELLGAINYLAGAVIVLDESAKVMAKKPARDLPVEMQTAAECLQGGK